MEKLRSTRDALWRLWIDRLWIDLIIVVTFLIVHAVLIFGLPAFDILGDALPADRRATYAAAAVVVSLLGSFSSVAISQLSSAKGARAEALRRQAPDTLAKNWRSIFRAGMLSALLAIFALLVDPSQVSPGVLPVVARWFFEGGLIFAIVKFMRLSSLFYQVITLASRSESDETPKLAEPLRVDSDWAKKRAS